MAILKNNGNEFYYEVHGEGEPVVLAHGLGGNHATWYKQVNVLSQAYQVITFDHRGFGLSTDNEKAGRAEFSNDLLALFNHLDIKKAALIGQSMGGGTAITFTCQHPDRVAGLIIADSLHGLVESDEVAKIMDESRSQTKNLSQIDRVLGKSFAIKNPDQAVLYQQINSFNKTERSNLVGQYADTKFTPEQLANTHVPVMFVAGQDDILFPIDAIRLVQEQVAGSFIVEFDDCGHSAFYEKPTEFNDTALTFLQMAGLKPLKKSVHSNSAGYQKA